MRKHGVRRAVMATALVFALLSSTDAKASVFGEENAALFQLVGLQIEELIQVSTLLANIKLILSGVNDVAAGVRTGYRVYQVVKNYSVKDLINEANLGLQEAFPEIKDVIREANELNENINAAEQNRFFAHKDHHDPKMDRLFDAAFRHAARATIWPAIFPGAIDSEASQRSRVDDLILRRYQRSGMELRRAMQETALGVLVQKTSALVTDAEEKGRADLQAQAINAQISAQNLNNTTRMRDLAETDAAIRENEEQKTQAYDEMARNSLADDVNMLMKPAWSRR